MIHDPLDAQLVADNDILQMIYPLVEKIKALTVKGTYPAPEDYEEVCDLVTRREQEITGWIANMQNQSEWVEVEGGVTMVGGLTLMTIALQDTSLRGIG